MTGNFQPYSSEPFTSVFRLEIRAFDTALRMPLDYVIRSELPLCVLSALLNGVLLSRLWNSP